jgi:hypothetical protein
MKCHLCGSPVPLFACVLWCDACIDEWLRHEREETMGQFIARKRAAA